MIKVCPSCNKKFIVTPIKLMAHSDNEETMKCDECIVSSIFAKIKKADKMGVSMGIIEPIKGDAAKELLKDIKCSDVDDETLEQCRKISKLIKGQGL